MTSRVKLVATSALLLSLHNACGTSAHQASHVVDSAQSAARPVLPCAHPSVDTREWLLVAADIAAIELRIPPGLSEHRYRETAEVVLPRSAPDSSRAFPRKQWWQPRDPRDGRYSFAISRTDLPPGRIVRGPHIADLAECSDTIGGREVFISSWRMPNAGGPGRGRYALMARVQLDSIFALEFSGSAATPELLQSLMATLRSLRFRDEPLR